MTWNIFGILSLLTLTIGIGSVNSLYILNSNGTLETLETLSKINNSNSAETNNLLLNTTQLETIQFRTKHTDEEDSLINGDSNEDANDLKYEVEIIQPGRIEKEDLEIEERFKGPSLNFDTNEFIEENIEVNSQTIQPGHVILTIALILLAFVSVGIYAGLVMWRSSLEKRYGMRQRLMTEDDFCTSIHDTRPY